MIEIKAPNSYSEIKLPKIFLAGSIEMGVAEKWQDKVTSALSHLDVCILNPRRDDWHSSWVQSIDNPQFYEQVTWELDGLIEADFTIFYFDPNTKSPITLMELGIVTGYSNVIVCCPEGFWRKGNVDIVCDRFNIATVPTLDRLIEAILDEVKYF